MLKSVERDRLNKILQEVESRTNFSLKYLYCPFNKNYKIKRYNSIIYFKSHPSIFLLIELKCPKFSICFLQIVCVCRGGGGHYFLLQIVLYPYLSCRQRWLLMPAVGGF